MDYIEIMDSRGSHQHAKADGVENLNAYRYFQLHLCIYLFYHGSF